MLAALPLLLSGCLQGGGMGMGGGMGSAGDHHEQMHGSGETMADPYTGQEDLQFVIEAGVPSEFRFTPDRFNVTAGATVGVTFTNRGDTAHEFAILELDLHLHAASGQTVQGSFTAPAAGEYGFGCYIPGHYEAGMKGTMTVQGA